MSDNAHDLKIPSLCVTAVGSGACSAVERLASLNPEIAAYIGIDCWGTNLPLQQIQHKIYLGSDHNQMYGCGGNPQVGQLATENAFREIYQAVEGYPIVIIVGCMGGGCASGGAHIVARIAKSQGASVISLVTAPFQFEGSQRSLNAANGIAELQKYSDSLFVIPNDLLVQSEFGTTPIELALREIDRRFEHFIITLNRLMTITRENQNNEMALIKTIQDKKGIWCENFFVNKASEIPQYLNKLTNASMLPSIDFSTAHRCIAQISVNYICTIEEIQNYIDTLKNYFIDCDLQFVVNFHEKSKSLVEISLLMSGVGGTGIDYTSIKWNNLHHQQNDTTDEKSFSIEAFDQNNTQDFEIPSFLRKHDVIYD